MTPPAKKTVPSLKELQSKDTASDKAETTEPKETKVTTPTVEEQVSDLPKDEGFDQSHVGTNNPPDGYSGKTPPVVNESGNVATVPTWAENPDHNLGKLHPDMVKLPDPLHQSQTSKQVYVTEYAGVAELDDKGFPERETDETQEESGFVSEFAPENKHDDKNLKTDE